MLTLKLGQLQFPVQRLPLLQSCNSSALHQNPNFYGVQSNVFPDVFRDFLSAIEGQPIKITTDNFSILTELSTEFGFSSLLAELHSFTKSCEWELHQLQITIKEQIQRISVLESEIAKDRETFIFRLSVVEKVLKDEKRLVVEVKFFLDEKIFTAKVKTKSKVNVSVCHF
jgi:hypothetical protein